VAYASLLLLAAAGCKHAHLAPPPPLATVRPGFVSILTDPDAVARSTRPEDRVEVESTVVIENPDEGWKLTVGEPSPPPFLSDWPADVRPNLLQGGWGGPQDPKGALLEEYDVFLKSGAHRCRATVASQKAPLYCVLALLPVIANGSSSSVRRTYRIAVPVARVKQALGGQVSVVFEPYGYTFQTVTDNGEREYYADNPGESASWILWISDAPFAGTGKANH
jgi:hypothetical protein